VLIAKLGFGQSKQLKGAFGWRQRTQAECRIKVLRIGDLLVRVRAVEALYDQAKQGDWGAAVAVRRNSQTLGQE
jgi:hypothetical protein